MTEPVVGRMALRVSEVAIAFDVSQNTVRRWIKRGDLKSFRVGSTVRVPMREVQKLLNDPTPTRPRGSIIQPPPVLSPKAREFLERG